MVRLDGLADSWLPWTAALLNVQINTFTTRSLSAPGKGGGKQIPTQPAVSKPVLPATEGWANLVPNDRRSIVLDRPTNP